MTIEERIAVCVVKAKLLGWGKGITRRYIDYASRENLPEDEKHGDTQESRVRLFENRVTPESMAKDGDIFRRED